MREKAEIIDSLLNEESIEKEDGAWIQNAHLLGDRLGHATTLSCSPFLWI